MDPVLIDVPMQLSTERLILRCPLPGDGPAVNEAERESREHPLNRLMELRELPDRLDVAPTDIHLPRRIGTALKRAYDGELDVRFGDNEYSVRVVWHR
mgnify:CR=1 FL=1